MNPAPVTVDGVLSPQWLSEALSDQFPGVEVTGSEVTETLRTVATKVRFAIDCAPTSGSRPPAALCVKGYFDRAEQGYGAGQTEGQFYRHLAPHLPVRTPPCVYVGSDPDTEHTLILMRDLKAEGATFLTALTPYSVDQAASTLDQLALLHASHWNDPELITIPWLESRIAKIPDSFPIEVLQSQLDGRRGDPLAASVRDASRLDAAMRKLSTPDIGSPICIVHGDVHAGNVYITAEGSTGLIDWQIVHRGCWAADVAYHIAASLSVDERERSEAELLRHYLGRLQANGVEAPDWDEAWSSYRRYLAYGYYLWGITRFVDEEITVEFVKRLGSAVAQHKSFEELGV
jgi:aminoglycoside phosphotransferase (APT) family kinase protein